MNALIRLKGVGGIESGKRLGLLGNLL